MALTQITEIIKVSIVKYGCGIFIELRKDFIHSFTSFIHIFIKKNVWHSQPWNLLKKLEYYGITAVNMLKWSQSYLSNWKQYVSVNDHSSVLLDNICGVPQGSILRPLLFTNISKVLNFYLFADDTNIYYVSGSLQENNKELNKLYLWLNVNLISLNIDKTNYIIYQPFNKPEYNYKNWD